MADGHNPMRWDCEKNGCFNKKRRPKIEVFHDLFPGKISFGDIDGIVEVNGHALLLEWKSFNIDLPRGQKIMYERLTRISPITVLVISGDAESMRMDNMLTIENGKIQGPYSAELVRVFIERWVVFAEKNSWALRECLNEKITVSEYYQEARP